MCLYLTIGILKKPENLEGPREADSAIWALTYVCSISLRSVWMLVHWK